MTETLFTETFVCVIQISRKERPLYVQAANCVEEKEWIDLLNKVL